MNTGKKRALTPALIALTLGLSCMLIPTLALAEGGEGGGGVDWAQLTMGLLGGLALFLFGMDEMSNTLKVVAGDRIKKVLRTLSSNRIIGVLTGAGTTAVVQSSSVTTVIVVGFVSAGLMTLPQALGVILGANIGTTITAQIVAFHVTKYALGLVAIGFTMKFVFKKPMVRQWGTLVLGLGLIFFGMAVMGEAMKPLRAYQPFLDLMGQMEHPLLAVLLATGFTALIQSSSATTGIIIALASQGLLSLEAGIALALGANIGTCITAILAAIGKPREAIRAAVAHSIFNVLGVVIVVPLIPSFAEFLMTMAGGGAEAHAAAAVPRHIANAHTIFNVGMTVVFLPFLGPYARLLHWIVPEKKSEVAAVGEDVLDPALTRLPAAALTAARRQIRIMTAEVATTLADMDAVLFSGETRRVEMAVARERMIAGMHVKLARYLSSMTTGELSEDTASEVLRVMNVANGLKNMTHIAVANMVRATTGSGAVAFQQEAINLDRLNRYQKSVHRACETALDAFLSDDAALAYETIRGRVTMNTLESDLRESSTELLRRSSDPLNVEAYATEMEIIANLDQIYHHAYQIAQSVVGRQHGDESDDDHEGDGQVDDELDLAESQAA